ncbi:MAG: transcriptional regulator [Gammaproteobacteria bacterium]|nr:transcriptional regulator [Gammaproteobacteria bacterium]
MDETLILHKSKGNGILKRRAWVDEDEEVTRYSLAYINHYIYSGDNGRVLGYDNSHNYHHRHHMGETAPVVFKSFQDIEERFQQEFEVIHEKFKKKR